jgi:hypothetical protein
MCNGFGDFEGLMQVAAGVQGSGRVRRRGVSDGGVGGIFSPLVEEAGAFFGECLSEAHAVEVSRACCRGGHSVATTAGR